MNVPKIAIVDMYNLDKWFNFNFTWYSLSQPVLVTLGQMCLEAKHEKLCAWAHVPLCPTNVGPVDGLPLDENVRNDIPNLVDNGQAFSGLRSYK